jgi:uncharacterized iron-regulated membrane protein
MRIAKIKTALGPFAAGLHRPLSRAFWVVVHRWAGLTLAAFLVVAGLTGAIIPFEESLSLASRGDLSGAAPPVPGALPLDAVTLADRVEGQTGGQITYLPLEVPRGHVLRMFISAAPGGPPLGYDAIWVDPYSGVVRARFTWGGVRDGAINIVPFLYQLHYGYVAGVWGMWTFGVAALIWTLDCVVGFGLTLPALRRRSPRDPEWWRRWRPAWVIRRARGYKRTFDLHRASGLWLWPMLLVFAWSGVALALPSVEQPVMRLLGASAVFTPPPRAAPLDHPAIDRRSAIARAMGILQHRASIDGVAVEYPTMLAYDAASGVYALYARTSLDTVAEGGETVLWLDATDGRPLRFDDPIGRSETDRFMKWITLLHMAEVFGLPYRIVVSLLGLTVAALAITGVMIWLRKRTARLSTARRLRRRAP